MKTTNKESISGGMGFFKSIFKRKETKLLRYVGVTDKGLNLLCRAKNKEEALTELLSRLPSDRLGKKIVRFGKMKL